jgi:outer membrane protein TolC
MNSRERRESLTGFELLIRESLQSRTANCAPAADDRRELLARAVRTLVDNQLRPGAEASRSEAERAAAQTRLIQAQQAVALAQISFTRVLGVTTEVSIDATTLLDRLPTIDVDTARMTMHPLVQVRQAAVDVARAQAEELSRVDLPRVYLQSSIFARGSGANAAGQLDGGRLAGIGLDRANWAAGVQVVFPNAFDFASLRARKAAAAASARAEGAFYDEALLTVTSQQQVAAAMVRAARAIAANTPIQLAAAQQSEAQARARYQAGLANIVEVADTQSLLAQAEVQDQVARIDVWRALLTQATAQGNLAPFLSALNPSPGAR